MAQARNKTVTFTDPVFELLRAEQHLDLPTVHMTNSDGAHTHSLTAADGAFTTIDGFIRSSATHFSAVGEEPMSSEDDDEVILTPKLAFAAPKFAAIRSVDRDRCSKGKKVISGSYPDHDYEQRDPEARGSGRSLLDRLPEPAGLKPEIIALLKASREQAPEAAEPPQTDAPSLAVPTVDGAPSLETVSKQEYSKPAATSLDFLAALADSLSPVSASPVETPESSPRPTFRMRMPTIPHPRIPSPQRPSNSAVEPYSLTRIAIARLLQSLPKAFPKQAKALQKLSLDDLTGENDLDVAWRDGVGFLQHLELGEPPTGPVTQVFVDHSNILFAHIDHLDRLTTGYLPPKHQRTLSLPALSLLLQRGRPAPPGSLHLVGSSPLRDRPDLDRLIRLGWEVNVLKRVSAGSDVKRFREQGVDELLQLKMLQALNIYPTPAPGSTIVLATGDAQSGQFNRDGFVGVVREALRRGWNVELWSFKRGLSRTWKETAKAEGWTRFSIRALDDFAEDLVEIGDGVMTDE